MMTLDKETRDLIIECCVGNDNPCWSNRVKTHPSTEFIHLISSEANEICEQESKKTIAPEHIITALKVPAISWPPGVILSHMLFFVQRLGFDAFTDEVEDVLKDHKQQQKVRCAKEITVP